MYVVAILAYPGSTCRVTLATRSFDNSYSKADLSLTYRPTHETIIDHAEQIINSGMLD